MARDTFASVSELATNSTIRLAVTGLSRAGKSVFITSLAHNLLSAVQRPERLPLLEAVSDGRLISASVQGAAARTVPLFPYKYNIASMAALPPVWPIPTDDISEIEINIRFRPGGWKGKLRSLASDSAVLRLQLVDYPGEWLLDLPLLEQSYLDWSRSVLELCSRGMRAEEARDWLDLIASCAPDKPADDDTAKKCHDLYRQFLGKCRDRHGLSFLQPGRFVRPGALGEPPYLWFSPLDFRGDVSLAPGSLGALMNSRFEAYKKEVIEPFYRTHFRSFDRQIVLVDVLKTLLAGEDAFSDTRLALDAIMASFRFGNRSILPGLFGHRIDRVLFAATKADHVTQLQRDHLAQLLANLISVPLLEARNGKASTEVMTISSVICTEDGTDTIGDRTVDIVVGLPVGKEKRIKFFPGPIPIKPPKPGFWNGRFLDMPVFQPPSLEAAPTEGIPHINLDAALEYLLGDKLS